MELTRRVHLCGSGAFGLTCEGDCHCYVLDGGNELALIDCGLARNPQAILQQMEKDGLDIGKLRYLLLTHAHPDHANGCSWFQEHMEIRIMASKFEAQVMEYGLLETLGVRAENGKYQQFAEMARCRADHIIEDNEVIQVGNLKITALMTPGHTAGSTSYEVEMDGQRNLFTGDEVFYKGFVSVLTAPFSDFEHYYEGLKRLEGRGINGLFPSHLMWTLRNGQKHIDKALWDFEVTQRPNLKPFS